MSVPSPLFTSAATAPAFVAFLFRRYALRAPFAAHIYVTAPATDNAVIEDSDFYHYVKYGYDLIYSPWETKFMGLVRANGGMAYNGLKMLLYQGIDAFELWNGCKVPDECAGRVYKKLCGKLGQE